MSRWRRIMELPGIVDGLVAGQLQIYNDEKVLLQSHIDKVAGYPEGRLVWTIDGYITQAEWSAEATAAMSAIDVQIAKLS